MVYLDLYLFLQRLQFLVFLLCLAEELTQRFTQCFVDLLGVLEVPRLLETPSKQVEILAYRYEL